MQIIQLSDAVAQEPIVIFLKIVYIAVYWKIISVLHSTSNALEFNYVYV
jgi:hypothetical protein